MSNNKKKAEQLGMPYGTANGKLRKQIMFRLLSKLGENFCFQCGQEIQSEDTLSVEHKIPWLDNSPDLFWDLDNIAFSHLSCNSGSHQRDKTHCKQGHSYSTKNTRVGENGWRDCRECSKVWSRNYREKNRIVISPIL